MDRIIQPDKEAIRDWMRQRRTRTLPLPDTEQIRRELGWKLVRPVRQTHQG